MVSFWRWLWPAVCLVCHHDLDWAKAPLCRPCQRTARRQGWVAVDGYELEDVYAGRRFEGAARQAILRFKYSRRFYLGRFFASWFGRRPPFVIDAATVIMPIPMAPVRRWFRGYNPAEMFANELSKRWALPVRKGWLARRWRSSSQTRLGRRARERNARAGYRVTVRRLPPVSVILVDDVVTTGATLRACARLLQRKGVGRVWAVAIAYDALDGTGNHGSSVSSG